MLGTVEDWNPFNDPTGIKIPQGWFVLRLGTGFGHEHAHAPPSQAKVTRRRQAHRAGRENKHGQWKMGMVELPCANEEARGDRVRGGIGINAMQSHPVSCVIIGHE